MTTWLPTLLGAAWGGVVLTGAWRRRPRPRQPLATTGRPADLRPGFLGHLGRLARQAAPRPLHEITDRAVGGALVASLVLLVVAPVMAPAPWLAAAVTTRRAALRARRREAEAWAAAVPDAVDLFGLALAGGMTVPEALALVAPRAPPPLGPALVRANLRFRHGEPLDEALGQVGHVDPAAGPLVAVLVAAHCDGAPVAEPLARLADEHRSARRRRAEARARQVPVRMLFPLVGCTLPAFVLVTVVPAVAASLSDLRW